MFTEALESRRMLAASGYTFKTGVLTVTGGSKADSIVVRENTGSVHLEITDQAHKVFKVVDLAGVSSIKINGGGQGDSIFYTGNSIGAVIHGNGGSDSITVDDTGTAASQVFGDAGDDSITGLQGHQTSISGGSGNDSIVVGADGSGTGLAADSTYLISADKGKDYIEVENATATVSGGAGFDSLVIRADQGGSATYGADVEQVAVIT